MSGARRVVVVHLMGGLGNQLFQYAFGRRLAVSNRGELHLDASGYLKYGPEDNGRGVRACELQYFNIAAKILGRENARASMAGSIQRRFRKGAKLLRRLVEKRKPYFLRQEIVEPDANHFRFDPQACGRIFSGTIYVRGFWQSEKYFSDIEAQLRRELTWTTELKATERELATMISETTSVAIHVRRGDFAGLGAWHGILGREYYEAAVLALTREAQNVHFFVFSDDAASAFALLGGISPCTFVSRHDAGSAHEDLRLIALCRHHIIANSTFSWWGAWLGNKDGQIVYAPRRYFQNVDRPNPDLYPDRWRLI